jgi:hypothetical protein
MGVLQGALPGTHKTGEVEHRGIVPGDNGDDLSGRVHRRLIGAVGLMMPVLLWSYSAVFPGVDESRVSLLGSISDYYYSAAVGFFVGLLVALSLYLLAYQGFDNKWRKWDLLCARVAAVAALGVALFPCGPPDEAQRRPWWLAWMVWVHYGSAGVLFAAFAMFSLVLFTRTDPAGFHAADEKWRHAVYRVCGMFIIGGMIGSLVLGKFMNRPIFWPESVVLVAFAISWLVKGSIHKAAIIQKVFLGKS